MSALKKSKKVKLEKAVKLKLIRGGRISEHHHLVNGLWIVAQSALWNTKNFSVKETEELKALIAAHFTNTEKNSKRNFKDLVERICLAKRFVGRRKGRYISKPIDWLNIHYKNGLAGTATWLEQVKEQRKTVPHYNEGISTLANGMLKYMESPNMIVYQRYKKMLLEQKQFDLVQVFQVSIINLQYSI